MQRKVKIAVILGICGVVLGGIATGYWVVNGVMEADEGSLHECTVLKYAGGRPALELRVVEGDELHRRLVAYVSEDDARRGCMTPVSFIPGLLVDVQGIRLNFVGDHVIVNGEGMQRIRAMRDADRQIVEDIMRNLQERGAAVDPKARHRNSVARDNP